MPIGHQGHGRSKLGHFRGVASAAPREAAVGRCSSAWRLVVVSVYPTTAVGNSEQNIAFLNTLGQVLRAIDLPFPVCGDFNLAGDELGQPGWLHAVRARIAAPSSGTPTCSDCSSGEGKVIDFFVVSEELHSFVKTVAVDARPTVIRTHKRVVPMLEGVKRGRLVQRPRRPARPPRTAQVGPSRRPLDTLSECGQQEHSNAGVRATLGDARWKRKSSVVTTLSTRKSTQAG